MKKDYTEAGYIEDTVIRLALIHPDIAFRLISSGKTILQTSGSGKMQDVIYAIYGRDIANSILEVDYTYEDIHITGVVGKPQIARSNRSNQLFFVNKRYVKDKTLTGATENSFKGLLPIGKYGFLVLNLDMDPASVDVNVHPAKLEVRFQEENKVFKSVYHAIKDTLLKAELIANTEKTEETEDIKQPNTKSSIADLFRKIKKTEEIEQLEKHSDNVIEQIYNEKTQSIPIIKDEMLSTPQNNQSINKQEQSKQDKKMDVFKELLAMQQKLKEETKNNPSINTNIDEIMKNTQNLENTLKNADTVNNKEENQETSTLEETKKEVKQDEIKESEILPEEKVNEAEEVVVENKQDDTPIGSIQTNLEIEQENSNTEDNLMIISYNTEELDTKEKIEEKEAEYEQTESTNTLSQNTKDFNMEEIEEMMDKLEKIDNIENSPEFSNMYEKIFGKLPASVEEEKRKEDEKISAYELIQDNNISVFEGIPEYEKPVYKLIGVAFNTYIIIEIEKELYIIDQHAAHERVMYEKVKENYYSDSNKDSQMLLLPDIITLTHKEIDILKDNYELFEKAGFVLDEFGDNTIKLSGVPNICLELDTKELFLETLDEINQVARTAKQEIEERFIATVACKAAVKANMDLTKEEIDNLMSELLKLPNPFTCPHGRPTAIKMDKNDIEKKFARRK